MPVGLLGERLIVGAVNPCGTENGIGAVGGQPLFRRVPSPNSSATRQHPASPESSSLNFRDKCRQEAARPKASGPVRGPSARSERSPAVHHQRVLLFGCRAYKKGRASKRTLPSTLAEINSGAAFPDDASRQPARAVRELRCSPDTDGKTAPPSGRVCRRYPGQFQP